MILELIILIIILFSISLTFYNLSFEEEKFKEGSKEKYDYVSMSKLELIELARKQGLGRHGMKLITKKKLISLIEGGKKEKSSPNTKTKPVVITSYKSNNHLKIKLCASETPFGKCKKAIKSDSKYCTDHYEMKQVDLPTQEQYAKMTMLIQNAIKEKGIVEFTYWRGITPGKRRKLIPQEMNKTNEDTIMIKGKCLLRNDERIFNIIFIRNLTRILGKNIHEEISSNNVLSNKQKKKPDKKETNKYFSRKYNYGANFSDRKINGMSVSQTLDIVSGMTSLCFSPITTAIFCWVNRNRKKVKNTYRKEIKNEIDLYLKDRVSYNYISNFILELYGRTDYHVPAIKENNEDLVRNSFRYSKKMLRRIVLTRKGISPQEATLEFKKSADFKKSMKILENLEDKIKFLGKYKIRKCDKCRLIGIEALWFKNFKRRGKKYYKNTCLIC